MQLYLLVYTLLNFSLFDLMKNKLEIYCSLVIFDKRFIEKITTTIVLVFSLRFIDKNILSFLRI